MLTLIGIAAQNAGVAQETWPNAWTMVLFAAGFVSLAKAACLVCSSPGTHIQE